MPRGDVVRASQGGGQRRGRMVGHPPLDPAVSACPKCGHKEPHAVGQPCIACRAPSAARR